jgi:hypothetical protein
MPRTSDALLLPSLERTAASSPARRPLGTTSSSAGPRSAGHCSVCDCERVRVPASTALAVAARPPRGRQGERPAFAAAGVSADERAGDLLSAEVRTLPCEWQVLRPPNVRGRLVHGQPPRRLLDRRGGRRGYSALATAQQKPASSRAMATATIVRHLLRSLSTSEAVAASAPRSTWSHSRARPS